MSTVLIYLLTTVLRILCTVRFKSLKKTTHLFLFVFTVLTLFITSRSKQFETVGEKNGWWLTICVCVCVKGGGRN